MSRPGQVRPPYPRQPAFLFSAFLSKTAIVSSSSKSMMFALDLRIQVPRYEINGKVKRSQYIRESYIFRNKLNPRVLADEHGTRLYYDWDSNRPNATFQHAELETTDSGWRWFTPIVTRQDP